MSDCIIARSVSLDGEEIVRFWIGSHADQDALLAQM